ncbi:MAG TPA: phosphoenolpyruvate--protein phosphotransferase [Haloplasmataceae bacterium]
MIRGISASLGIAIAKAYTLKELVLNIAKKEVTNPELEIERLNKAIALAEIDLQKLYEHTLEKLGKDKAEIFSAHLLVLKDPELLEQVKASINNEKVNAEYALKEVRDMFVSIFENMDNEYMKERSTDIKDVTDRVLAKLLNVKTNDLTLIKEEVILVAHDLTPSDTAQMDTKYVKGIVTNIGGRTSHAAIMARSLEIPAVVGTKNVLGEVTDGMLLILDAISGEVIVNPTKEQIKEYEERKRIYEIEKQELKQLKDQKSISKDGVHVELAANIGSPNDLKGVLDNGAEAIGLFRTEFLYMGKDNLPKEEEQFEAYKSVLQSMNDKPVVIRTLDIGGDKHLPYLPMPEELNPFLGYRAIRLCLDRKDIFKTQLRALLRASIYGKLRIMFPMIATLDEFIEAKNFLLSVKEELIQENIAVSEDVQVGMMVEIPSAAILADKFAKVVDFFSIGTNDLIQYTFAADRMNEHVSYLYQPYNPSLLRLIKMVIDAAHKENKWVGMCGEMAGEKLAIPILLGMGLDEFSMSATSILPARKLISRLSQKEMETLAKEALNKNNVNEVIDLVKQYI